MVRRELFCGVSHLSLFVRAFRRRETIEFSKTSINQLSGEQSEEVDDTLVHRVENFNGSKLYRLLLN